MKKYNNLFENDLKKFRQLLSKYDWWYSYSDDHSVYKKGEKQSQEISNLFQKLLKTSDYDDAVQAYIDTARRKGDDSTADHLKKKYL